MATPDSRGPLGFPKTTPPALLILILDIHPISWSLLSNPAPAPTAGSTNGTNGDPTGSSTSSSAGGPPATLASKLPIQAISLPDFLPVLLVFLNSHLASRWGNRVVVFAASAGRSKLLYPVAGGEEAGSGAGEDAGVGEQRRRANAYHPFRALDKGVEEGLKGMIAEEQERMAETGGEGLNDQPAIVSAMTKALCYFNRHSPTPSSSADSGPSSSSAAVSHETRILVINATPGGPAVSSEPGGDDINGESGSAVNGSKGTPNAGGGAGGSMRGGYVGLMNCVFAAQKAKIPIDVLSLPPPSTGTAPPIFLQQASHLTEGVYWRWNGRGGLLQYLHTIFLSPPSLRQTPFSIPPQDAVDFRAVCFCHQDVVDVGFVCSVCLSIFCKPLPVCQMCKTKFPIKSLPQLKALAAGLQPIPIPETIPPPPPAIPRGKDGGAGDKSKKRKGDEVIVVD